MNEQIRNPAWAHRSDTDGSVNLFYEGEHIWTVPAEVAAKLSDTFDDTETDPWLMLINLFDRGMMEGLDVGRAQIQSEVRHVLGL